MVQLEKVVLPLFVEMMGRAPERMYMEMRFQLLWSPFFLVKDYTACVVAIA